MKQKLLWPICVTISLSIAALNCSQSEQDQLLTQAAAAATLVVQAQTEAPPRLTQFAAAAGTAQALATQGAGVVQTVAANLTPASRPSFTIDSNLTELVTVSGSGLDDAIKAIRSDSPLIGLGQTFVDVGRSEGMNAFYIAAHAAWESTWGTSRIANDKNNLFGYGAYDRCPYECALTFKTKAECVETVMPLIKANYLTEGGKYYNGPTLRGMNVKYATDQKWKDGIAAIINSLAAKAP